MIMVLMILSIGIGYQAGKIYRNYCWDIISIMKTMLCERLVGRTRILLKQKEKQEDFVKYLPVFLKQTIDYIYIRFLITM